MDHEEKWLRAYVEKCMRELWDDAPVGWDDDGDIGFRGETSMVWVSFRAHDPRVAVFAHAAFDVKESVGLLRELNDVTGRSCYAHAYVRNGVVLVEATLHAESVNPTTLKSAIDAVVWTADSVGPMVATVYGGSTPFPATACESESEAE